MNLKALEAWLDGFTKMANACGITDPKDISKLTVTYVHGILKHKEAMQKDAGFVLPALGLAGLLWGGKKLFDTASVAASNSSPTGMAPMWLRRRGMNLQQNDVNNQMELRQMREGLDRSRSYASMNEQQRHLEDMRRMRQGLSRDYQSTNMQAGHQMRLNAMQQRINNSAPLPSGWTRTGGSGRFLF